MTTDLQRISAAVLDEAEAIVQAEWLRLTRDEDPWARELAEFLTEAPAPRPRPARGGTTTTAVRRRPTPLPPTPTSAAWPLERSPAPTVWASQRSPPAAIPGPKIQRCSRTMEVMP
jgi:hypothetical protein